MASGKAIVAAFAVVAVAAAALFVAYAVQQHGAPAVAMRFECCAPAPANTTATVLDYKPVHAAYFLEDHLDTAALRGNSAEDVRLRVESMQETLAKLTGIAGPEWWVAWEGDVVHVVVAAAPATA
ncbi:MAG: hypothetical protein ABR562_08845 [Thermoplasmatota archaeon]